jgi:hypothetical protein
MDTYLAKAGFGIRTHSPTVLASQLAEFAFVNMSPSYHAMPTKKEMVKALAEASSEDEPVDSTKKPAAAAVHGLAVVPHT